MALGMLSELMESVGVLPRQISAVLIALFVKPTGGFRPIWGVLLLVQSLAPPRPALCSVLGAAAPRRYWAAG
eukprot:5609869-Pyramimonas_sp.AAC.1